MIIYRHSGTDFPSASYSRLYCVDHKPNATREGGVVREERPELVQADATCFTCHRPLRQAGAPVAGGATE